MAADSVAIADGEDILEGPAPLDNDILKRAIIHTFCDCWAMRSARSRLYNPSEVSYNWLTSARKEMCSAALSVSGS